MIRLMMLEGGDITVIEEFSDSLIFTEKMDDKYFVLRSKFKRFDHQVVSVYGQQDQQQPRRYDFKVIDLSSKQVITHIHSEGIILPNFQLNWNIEEIRITFFKDRDMLEGTGELIFEISPLKGYRSSLKHLSRLTVLTSFDPDFLANQNLPSSLFSYLGIEK